MGKFERPFAGKAERYDSRVHGAVSNGWRKPSVALVTSERLADQGAAAEIDKKQAIVAVKRIAVHLGLKAADMLVLDTLSAFTQPQDWQEGQRPIVWASNAYLMEQTGFSRSTLKRHTRRLAEAGLIAFQDSSNGKRWGHRDAQGYIVEAYGFDLSPMGVRIAEFEALAVQLQAERSLCQRLKRQITITRRTIRARLDAAAGQGALEAAFQDALAQLPKPGAGSRLLAQVLDGFTAILRRVEDLLVPREVEEAGKSGSNTEEIEDVSQNMNPKGVTTGPHIPTTKDSKSVTCNFSEKEKEGEDCSEISKPALATHEGANNGQEVRTGRRVALDLPVLMQACPEFTQWVHNLGEYVRDWSGLHRVAGQLRPMIGISEPAWNAAQVQMGKPQAAAALALIFDKFNAGEISSPGGYLRGMLARDLAGELHLERSIYGRLGRAAA